MQFRASSRLRWPRLLFSLARRRTLVDYDTISTIGNIPGSSIDQFILCKKHAAAGVCTCEGGETSWVVEATPAKNRRELKLFQTFLASEYSSETLSFVCRARAYQKSPTATVRDFIIDTYVKEGAPQQINLCDETRRHLCRLASSAFVDADLFEPAVRHCSELLHNDHYPRFLQSEFYHMLHPPETPKHQTSAPSGTSFFKSCFGREASPLGRRQTWPLNTRGEAPSGAESPQCRWKDGGDMDAVSTTKETKQELEIMPRNRGVWLFPQHFENANQNTMNEIR